MEKKVKLILLYLAQYTNFFVCVLGELLWWLRP